MAQTPDPERFWQRVDRTGRCWLWTGYTDRDGYGILVADGKHWRAHRAAYALKTGPIPKGLMVLHSCDVPACCRPEHLRLGTAADNAADRVARSRNQIVMAQRWEQAGQLRLPETG